MGEAEWKYKFMEAKEHCKLSHDERSVFPCFTNEWQWLYNNDGIHTSMNIFKRVIQ